MREGMETGVQRVDRKALEGEHSKGRIRKREGRDETGILTLLSCTWKNTRKCENLFA